MGSHPAASERDRVPARPVPGRNAPPATGVIYSGDDASLPDVRDHQARTSQRNQRNTVLLPNTSTAMDSQVIQP